jgi:hypothetical protein
MENGKREKKEAWEGTGKHREREWRRACMTLGWIKRCTLW